MITKTTNVGGNSTLKLENKSHGQSTQKPRTTKPTNMASAATVAPIDPNRKKRKYNTGGAAAVAAANAAAGAGVGGAMGRDSDDEDFRGGGVDGEAGEKERYVSRENHCETERRRRIKMAA